MPDYSPTYADLCSAIADGGVIATLDGSMYEVSAFELRRYFQKSRILPDVSSLPQTPSNQDGQQITVDFSQSQHAPTTMQRH